MSRKRKQNDPLLLGSLGENWSEKWADMLDKRTGPDAPEQPAGSDEFCWCLDCEQVFPVQDIKVYVGLETGEEFLRCPVKDCTGGIADFHLWRSGGWIRSAHPEYPKAPAAYERYPL